LKDERIDHTHYSFPFAAGLGAGCFALPGLAAVDLAAPALAGAAAAVAVFLAAGFGAAAVLAVAPDLAGFAAAAAFGLAAGLGFAVFRLGCTTVPSRVRTVACTSSSSQLMASFFSVLSISVSTKASRLRA